MRCTCTMSSVACPTLQYFSQSSHKGYEFRKKLLNIQYVSWFSLRLFLECFSIQEVFSEILSKMYIGIHVKYPLFSSVFIEIWILKIDFRKIHRHQISWISVHWEPSCSVRTDGKTDRLTYRRGETNGRFF